MSTISKKNLKRPFEEADDDSDEDMPVAVSFKRGKELAQEQQQPTGRGQRGEKPDKKKRKRSRKERKSQKIALFADEDEEVEEQQDNNEQLSKVDAELVGEDNAVDQDAPAEDVFDESLLQQIIEGDERAKQAQSQPKIKEKALIEPLVSQFKGKHTKLDGTSAAPQSDRIRLFEDYHIQVQVRKDQDPLSKRAYIDPELPSWLQKHFYDGVLIKRVPTAQWHSEKRSHVGPSKQFLVSKTDIYN